MSSKKRKSVPPKKFAPSEKEVICQKCEERKNKKWDVLYYDEMNGHAFRYCYTCEDYFDDYENNYHDCEKSKKTYCESCVKHSNRFVIPWDDEESYCRDCIDSTGAVYEFNDDQKHLEDDFCICESKNRSPDCNLKIPISNSPSKRKFKYHRSCDECKKYNSE